jgi:hypothetical protein
MSRQTKNHEGHRPTHPNRGQSQGYFTDPEQDQKRGGDWGTPGQWTSENNATNNWVTSINREPLGSTSRPSIFSQTPVQSTNWNPPVTASGSSSRWNPLGITTRAFEHALGLRGRGTTPSTRGITTAPPCVINLNEPDDIDYTTSRRRNSPSKSSMDTASNPLTEQIRRAGVMTNIEERLLDVVTKHVIKDLLFQLKQSNDEKTHLLAKIQDLYKQQRTRKHDRDHNDREPHPIK